MRRTILMLAISLGGCSLEVDRKGTSFECDPGGTCPDGYSCVDNLCVRDQAPGCSDEVSAGREHSCALRGDRTVWCWGANSSGQLGDDSTVDKAVPTQVVDLTGAIALDAGDSFTCAADDKGAAWCWGQNGSGQLGDGSMSDSRRPGLVRNLASVTAIAAGASHACALSGGTVSCWGENGAGQLGDTTTSTRGMAAPVSGMPPAKAIAAGANHTCAVDMGGQLHCWGNNSAGQLGLGTTSNTAVTTAQRVPGLTGVTSVAAGNGFTCAIGDLGLVCFGTNSHDVLGDGGSMASSSPVAPLLPLPAVAVTAGEYHVCARDNSKGLWCWGRNAEAQLGDSTTNQRGVPVKTGFIEVAGVSAGGFHTCVLFDEGGIACTGSDDRGQLGDGRRTKVPAPQIVPGLGNASTIGTGTRHSCAGLMDGTVKCWGDNSQGQVGDGSFTMRTRPASVVALSGVELVTSGAEHTCAALSDGELVCWGANGNGQLGDGTSGNSWSMPRAVSLGGAPSVLELGAYSSCAIVGGAAMCWGAGFGNMPGDASNGLGGIRGLAKGANHTCAIQSDTSVACWGNNSNGQLGGGNTDPPASTTERILTGLSGAEKIYAEGDATCVVRTDRTAHCWGRNQSGWLGIPNTGPPVTSPTPVVGLADVDQLAMRPASNNTGYEGICARKTDGTIACWGQNGDGQIGDGTFFSRSTPVPVVGLTGVVDLAVGTSHTCAVKMDGTVACWGLATTGQLGDGVRATVAPVNARMTCP